MTSSSSERLPITPADPTLAVTPGPDSRVSENPISEDEMTSSSSERLPAAPTVAITPGPDSRVLENPISEDKMTSSSSERLPAAPTVAITPGPDSRVLENPISEDEMTSSSSERLSAAPTVAITPSPDSRVLENPISEDVVWNRLKEAGFDEERDEAALIAYIAKLESEVDDKREESLNKDVGIAKACISSLEKMLEEIHVECAETKQPNLYPTEAGFEDESVKKRDKAALIAYIAKPESELEKMLEEIHLDCPETLVCQHSPYPTGPSKKAKTDPKVTSGSVSVQKPKIHMEVMNDIKDTSPFGVPSFIKVFDGHPCMLWDVRGTEPTEDLASKNWRDGGRGGPVRNQGDHDNCWTYTSTDVCSSHLFIHKEEGPFRVLSAKYLTFYVSKDERENTRKEGGRTTHMCHGFPVIKGLEFIKKHGVPEEDPLDAKRDYSCIDNPPARDQLMFKFGDDVEFLESSKIEDLYQMLLHQPVAANMFLYKPEYYKIRTLDEVYEGPTSEKSTYGGIHSVFVLRVVKVRGKWAALVKLSHGKKVGAGGYMHISLTRMIMHVKLANNQVRQLKDKDGNEPAAEPSLLLRDFTGLKYGVNQKPETTRRKRD